MKSPSTIWLAMIESQLRRCLDTDPVTQNALAALGGKVVEVVSLSPEYRCFLFFEVEGVRLAGWHDGSVDASLRAPLVTLLTIVSRRMGEEHSWSEVPHLQLSGDHELLSELERIHRSMELDCEDLLCQKIGPVAGHALAEGVRQLGGKVEQLAMYGTGRLFSLLRDEWSLVLSEQELSRFYGDIQAQDALLSELGERVQQTASAAAEVGGEGCSR